MASCIDHPPLVAGTGEQRRVDDLQQLVDDGRVGGDDDLEILYSPLGFFGHRHDAQGHLGQGGQGLDVADAVSHERLGLFEGQGADLLREQLADAALREDTFDRLPQ
jgi:hypothetical protein